MFNWILNKPLLRRKTVKSAAKNARNKEKRISKRYPHFKDLLGKEPVVDAKSELEVHLTSQDVGISEYVLQIFGCEEMHPM